MDNSEDQLIYVNFNQDASCLAIGTERGFKIFHTSPFKDSVERSNFIK
jgi:autophagy-related protein 18